MAWLSKKGGLREQTTGQLARAQRSSQEDKTMAFQRRAIGINLRSKHMRCHEGRVCEGSAVHPKMAIQARCENPPADCRSGHCFKNDAGVLAVSGPSSPFPMKVKAIQVKVAPLEQQQKLMNTIKNRPARKELRGGELIK